MQKLLGEYQQITATIGVLKWDEYLTTPNFNQIMHIQVQNKIEAVQKKFDQHHLYMKFEKWHH